MAIFLFVLVLSLGLVSSSNIPFDAIFPSVKDDIYQQPVNFMSPMLKTPHSKDADENHIPNKDAVDGMPYFDFSKFDAYNREDAGREHNRIKRRAKRRGYKKYRRQEKLAGAEEPDSLGRDHSQTHNATTSKSESRRQANYADTQQIRSKHKKKAKSDEYYNPPQRAYEENYVEMPKDLYQAHLRPGVIFRIHMAEAIIKMQYRNYGEDKDESVIEADVEYLRLTRKVINDEITKFEDLDWLFGWFNNRSELIQEHMCNTKYYAVGIPPTMFTHPEEYMKRICLFDTVYIDHIPYVVGEDSSLMAAVAPPVLHCDAATCTSVPFIDSIMFDERLQRTNVRTVTRCQASCRAHCKNDADCLKRCSDRCLRS